VAVAVAWLLLASNEVNVRRDRRHESVDSLLRAARQLTEALTQPKLTVEKDVGADDYELQCKSCVHGFTFRITDEELKRGRRIKCPICAAIAVYSQADI